jgi:hypothetical protein
MRLHLRDPGITCGPIHRQEHFHDSRIFRDPGKRRSIVVTPFAEQEAWRS